MPEMRTDRLTGRTVLVAEDRANRPNEFAGGAAASAAGQTCPFCAGNESRTPPAVYELPDGKDGWQVRVVPNKYPAVTLGDRPHHMSPDKIGRQSAEQEQGAVAANSLFAAPAFGAHEVIIESPRHVDRMSALSAPELRPVLAAYADRLRHWRDDGRFVFALLFKNQGPQAGASLAHVHSQLIALPQVPPKIAQEFDRAKRRGEMSQECPYCRLIAEERVSGARIVLDRDGFVAFCPFASLQPMEVWLMPREHESAFEQPAAEDALARLSSVLQDLIGIVEAAVPGTSYNMSLRTAPWQVTAAAPEWHHWRIELLPRVTVLAGLELSAGMHINPLPPENAARLLRGEPIAD